MSKIENIGKLEKLSKNTADTESLAKDIYLAIKNNGNLHIDLQGNIGAGKTCFARHLINCFGMKGVLSPSFQTVLSYQKEQFEIHHLDLFRLPLSSELPEDLWEIVEKDSLRLVEWPERCSNLPKPDIMISFDLLENDHRLIKLIPVSESGAFCLKKLI